MALSHLRHILVFPLNLDSSSNPGLNLKAVLLEDSQLLHQALVLADGRRMLNVQLCKFSLNDVSLVLELNELRLKPASLILRADALFYLFLG